MGLGNNNGRVVFNEVTLLEGIESVVEKADSAFFKEKATFKDVKNMTSLEDLVAIAQNGTNSFDDRQTAIGQLAKNGAEGQKVLAEIATTDKNPVIRYFTVQYLTNLNALGILKNDVDNDISKAAGKKFARLSDFVQSVSEKSSKQLKLGA